MFSPSPSFVTFSTSVTSSTTPLIELHAASHEEILFEDGALMVGDRRGRDRTPDARLLMQDVEHLHEGRQVLAFQERT